MKFNCKEDIIQITPLWKGERMEDGRPKVSADVLRRLRKITLEEAWGPLWMKGYKYQFEGEFRTTHPGTTLVGRAVTGVMVPMRPDLNDYLLQYGHEEEGRKGYFNQWIIDSLVEDDVVVVDMFDKIFQGTYVGGNLSTAIKTRTKRGGAVIWGGIRDLDQVKKIEGIQIYYRGTHPTPIRDYVMTGYNAPCRIGEAICMPGDVVFGSNEGVVFVPAHLAEKTVDSAEKSHLKDDFGFERLKQGVYTATEIDANWSDEMWKDFQGWFKTSEIAAPFQYLDWEEDIERSRQMREHPESIVRKGPRTDNPPIRSTI